MQSALSQMGNAKQVGRRLAGEWKRKQSSSMSMELWAVLFTLAFYASAVVDTHSGNIFMGRAMSSTQMLVALAGLPLLTGSITGILFPKAAVPAVFHATLILVLMLWLPALLLLIVDPDTGNLYALKVFGVQAACWFPLSCLAAYGASALRRKKLYQLTPQDLRLQ